LKESHARGEIFYSGVAVIRWQLLPLAWALSSG